MITLTTTIQEITLQAHAFGVFDYLFNECNKSRDEIFNMFEEWGEEFEALAQQHKNDTDWFYYDEIDAFINKKFEEIKLSHLFPYGIAVGDYLTYEGGLYKITSFEDDAIAVDELHPGKDKDWVVCTIGFSQASKIKILDENDGIMDTTNNHNPELVKKINIAWIENCEKFRPILCALYERDIEEITDADSFQIPEWHKWGEYIIGLKKGDWSLYLDAVYAEMQTKWKDYAENYLMHIADDTDLECILKFIHFKD